MQDRSETPAVEDDVPERLPEAKRRRSSAAQVGAAILRARGLVRQPLEKAKSLLSRRRGARRFESTSAPPGESSQELLFDGSEESCARWLQAGSGSFERRGKELHLAAGAETGLVYYGARRFDDLRLRLHYRLESPDAAMTLAARFLDPRQPVPDREDPSVRHPYENPAYVAAHTGFEVELGVQERGVHPGTFHGLLVGNAPGAQLRPNDAPLRLDDWNELDLELIGNLYIVRINGVETARFSNLDDYRSKLALEDPHAGFIGFLMRRGRLALRDVSIESALPERAPDFVGGEGRK